MSEADEMARLLGFAAFGGSAARSRSRQRSREAQQQSALAQFVPGTELHALLDAADTAMRERFERGAHGVTFLINKQRDASSRTPSLASLLRGSVSCQQIELSAHLLPPRCYELLQELQDLKNRFDAVDTAAFYRARSAANPYERIGRGRFLNRSAMKLVNMDHLFEWTTAALPSHDSPFVFTDVCGGPGGFSEYLLWRVPRRSAAARVCGFGITLKDEKCDWKLSPSRSAEVAAPVELTPSEQPAPSPSPRVSFEISYGADGTGDLYQLANIRHFCDQVRGAHPLGVDLVVADGGFQDARDQADQEQCMTRLVLAETLAMFAVLKPHGCFVVKTFELTTPAMLQLVWLLHQCFDRVAVVKPVTSRPASSERYVVAQHRHDDLPMTKIVATLEAQVADPERSCDLLVDARELCNDAGFLMYMAAASDSLARAQIDACKRILELVESGKDAGGKRKRDWVDAAAYLRCWHLDGDDDDNDSR